MRLRRLGTVFLCFPRALVFTSLQSVFFGLKLQSLSPLGHQTARMKHLYHLMSVLISSALVPEFSTKWREFKRTALHLHRREL